MKFVVQWAMPLGFVALGIAIALGWLLQDIPSRSGLRPVFATVIILLGLHRFVVSRMRAARDERRFGGGRPRPWEKN